MAETHNPMYKNVLEVLVYLLAMGAIIFTVIMILVAALR